MSFARFTFSTAAFADSAETLAESINGIGGRALAEWLASALRQRGFDVSPVSAEDHGWDLGITHAGVRYHCSASLEGESQARDGGVTIGKSRSLMDRVTGRNKLSSDDAVVAAVSGLLTAHSGVRGLSFDAAN